jgi:general stress protein 26
MARVVRSDGLRLTEADRAGKRPPATLAARPLLVVAGEEGHTMTKTKATAVEKNAAPPETTQEKIERLYELIDKIDTGLLTTRRSDGHLVSRPMARQDNAPGADLWFVTSRDAHKLEEIRSDPNVNVAFYREKTREWVSVSGTARVTDDRETVRRIYKKDWKAWFPDEGPPCDGSPEDPRMCLIGVEAHTVVFMTSDKPGPLALFEIARAMATGTAPKWGDVHTISEEEIRR